MKKIPAYVTSDGIVHTSLKEAQKHADEKYGSCLLELAKELSAFELGQYTAKIAWLESDENLDKVLRLKALKEDINLKQEEDNA